MKQSNLVVECLILAVFCPLLASSPVSAISVTKNVTIASKFAAQHPEELRSPTPTKKATLTRLEGKKQKQGPVPSKPSSARVNKQLAPVYAELPEFKKEVARKIKDAFPNDAREMIAIAMAESGLRCEAINHADSNGVQAVGLFQINDGRWFNGQDITNLTDCDHNIERAKQKYNYGRFSPWGVWHTRAYQRYLWIYDQI